MDFTFIYQLKYIMKGERVDNLKGECEVKGEHWRDYVSEALHY